MKIFFILPFRKLAFKLLASTLCIAGFLSTSNALASDLSASQSQKISWEDLKPFLRHRIGMRPSAADPALFQFDIGSSFGPGVPDRDPIIDKRVEAALRNRAPMLAGIVAPLISGTIDRPDKSDSASVRNFYTEERLNSYAARLWERIETQSPPVVMSHLRFMMARELAPSLDVDGMGLGRSDSRKKPVRWKEVKPYVNSFIRIYEAEEKNTAQIPTDVAIGYKICAGDNDLAGAMNADSIDWNLAMVVFEAMSSQLSRDTVFGTRLNAVTNKIIDENPRYSSTRLLSLDPATRTAEIRHLQEEVHTDLMKDYAFVHSTKGFLSAAFADNNLPPLKD